MIPQGVLDAFGLDDALERLPGGENTSVRVGDVVLKPILDVDTTSWCQELAASFPAGLITTPTPVATLDGDWVAGEWSATRFISDLRSLHDDPHQVLDLVDPITTALNAAAEHAGPPPSRGDRWAVGFDAAYGDGSPPLTPEAHVVVEELRGLADDTTRGTQLVHGDLTGNVFLDGHDRPVVLDLSLYVASPGFAAGVVVADHLLWHNGANALIDAVQRTDLVPALLFRLVAEQLADNPRHGARLDDYRRVLSRITS